MDESFYRLCALYPRSESCKLLNKLGFERFQTQVHHDFERAWRIYHRRKRFYHHTPIHDLDSDMAEVFEEVLSNPNAFLEAKWDVQEQQLDIYLSHCGISYHLFTKD